MKLNKEQEQTTNPYNDLYEYVKRIVAAVKYKGEGDHEDVPSILKKFARGYEQKIFELTKEAEEWKDTAKYYRDGLSNVLKEKTKLAEENERLRADCVKGANALIEEMQLNRTIKADTVQKMLERVTEHATNGYPRKVRLDIIHQIAKEMLEGI